MLHTQMRLHFSIAHLSADGKSINRHMVAANPLS